MSSNNYIPTHNQQYINGNVNTISRQVVHKYLNVDSRFMRDTISNKPENFEVNLNSTIDNVVSMRVLSAELPNTFYNVTTKNNKFWITNAARTGLMEIVITPGKYTPSTLINKLNEIYPDDFCEPELHPNNKTYHVHYDTDTGKFLIERHDEETFDLVFIDDIYIDASGNSQPVHRYNTKIEKCGLTTNPRPSAATKILNDCQQKPAIIDEETKFTNLGYLLGYTQASYTGLSSYTSEKVATLDLNKYIYLSINDFNHNNSQSIIGNREHSLINDNIISRFSLTGETNVSSQLVNDRYSSIFNSVRVYHGPVKMNRLRIELLDEFGNTLELNGGHVSLLIELETLYNSNMVSFN